MREKAILNVMYWKRATTPEPLTRGPHLFYVFDNDMILLQMRLPTDRRFLGMEPSDH